MNFCLVNYEDELRGAMYLRAYFFFTVNVWTVFENLWFYSGMVRKDLGNPQMGAESRPCILRRIMYIRTLQNPAFWDNIDKNLGTSMDCCGRSEALTRQYDPIPPPPPNKTLLDLNSLGWVEPIGQKLRGSFYRGLFSQENATSYWRRRAEYGFREHSSEKCKVLVFL